MLGTEVPGFVVCHRSTLGRGDMDSVCMALRSTLIHTTRPSPSLRWQSLLGHAALPTRPKLSGRSEEHFDRGFCYPDGHPDNDESMELPFGPNC